MDDETKQDVSQPDDKDEQPSREHLSAEYYKEICSSIRFTDDMSFKLLNIVSVLSGIGSTSYRDFT